MSLLIHLIEQTADICKKLLLVLANMRVLLDAEGAGSVATVGNLQMDVLHPVVVHNVPLLAEEREWQIVTDGIGCQLG